MEKRASIVLILSFTIFLTACGPKENTSSLSFMSSETSEKTSEESKTSTAIISSHSETIIPVDSIALSQTSLSLYPGQSTNLVYEVFPENATDKTVVLSSDNLDIASVENGVVTAVHPGTCHIILSSSNGVTAQCEVTVKSVALKNFYFSKKRISLHVGDHYDLNPVFIPENATNKNITYSSNNASIAEVENGKIIAKTPGNAIIQGISEDGGVTSSCQVEIVDSEFLTKTPLERSYYDYGFNNIYGLGMTSTANQANLLVVPVWFSDSSTYIEENHKETMKKDIQNAFFGSKNETGWESVASYYQKASYGQFQISGTVTDWYDCGLDSTYLGNRFEGPNRVRSFASDVAAWVQENQPNLNLADYDYDQDGYLDGLIMIFGAPDFHEADSPYTYLWAYTSWTAKSRSEDAENPVVNGYQFSSYDFMYSHGDDAKEATGKTEYGQGDTTHCILDTRIYIHEIGHLFGLQDYYDYTSQCKPSGSFLMEDSNVGGEDPFSTMALGWTDPYIPKESTTLHLRPFQESGDVILLTPKWNDINSPFDEYLLLEYYTPTGLNEMDSLYQYDEIYPKGPSESGIRLWHVDGRFAYRKEGGEFLDSQITCDPLTSEGKVLNLMTNTYYKNGRETVSPLGKNYSDYNLLQLIRNDSAETYWPTEVFQKDDLFLMGDSFSMDSYSSQFANEGKLNSGLDLGWSFTVDLITREQVTITLTKTSV